MAASVPEKLAKLEAILRDLKRILVAFSGGVDSTFLLKTAVTVLGRENVLAVTAVSPTSTREELAWARKLARHLKARHETVPSNEFSLPEFRSNPPDRCYHCKRERFGALMAMARDRGLAAVADGSNADDVKDFRPGMKAIKELGVRSPLREAGMTKAEIRAASKRAGLPGWDRPAAACLASRCPYGQELTPEKLAMIEAAERYLASLGFTHVRVRTHELEPDAYLARIEVPSRDIDKETARKIDRRLRQLGYLYVTIDLRGYRMGSLNALVT
jgi:uncharacterized protein